MEADRSTLPGRGMIATFNLLRANDLIWPFMMNTSSVRPRPSICAHRPLMARARLGRCTSSTCADVVATTRSRALKLGQVAFDLGKVNARRCICMRPRSTLLRLRINRVITGSGKHRSWTNSVLPSTVEEWFAGAWKHQRSRAGPAIQAYQSFRKTGSEA